MKITWIHATSQTRCGEFVTGEKYDLPEADAKGFVKMGFAKFTDSAPKPFRVKEENQK